MTTTGIDYEALARRAAGNWQKFQSFAWFGRPPDPENWAVFYTRHRDSGLTDVSNHAAIARALGRFDAGENPTVLWQDHAHWGCGWVTAAIIRVYRRNEHGVTRAFQTWCDLQARLADDPILDETDYSNRRYESAIESIRAQGGCLVVANPPENWANRVYDWLSDHNGRALEDRDDRGACPSRDAIAQALQALRLWNDEA
jgi:hypothetical protein